LKHTPAVHSDNLHALESPHVTTRGILVLSFSAPLALCLLLATLLPAQTGRKTAPRALPPSAFKLIAVKVEGTKHYTPDEVAAATGLEIGKTVSEDDFKRASQRLGDTGAFSDIAYSFEYSPEGTKLDLQVTDSDHFVPARFDNFVWFSDPELLDQLHARVPLFRDQLPVAGNLVDQVSDALQALLIERNLQGRADYLRFAHADGPIEAFVFTVSGPDIRIRDIYFTGAGTAEMPLLQAAARQLRSQEYIRSIVRVQADKNLLPVFLARGYLKASFGDAQAKVLPDSSARILVDVTFSVDPGRQYKLTEVQWSGNTLFPTEKLQPLLQLQTGQPANPIRLDEDLKAVQELYGTRGYMAASVQPVPEMDDAQSTVRYLLQVHEGDAYKMGDLEIKGLDTRATGRLLAEWKLRAGDPYDSSYVMGFLDQALKLLPAEDLKTSYIQTLNDTDKTVDVTLRFSQNTSR
jgi:outer membrane protein assembly factor BamA